MPTPYSGNNRLMVSYGLTQALENLSPQPIVAKRAPTTADAQGFAHKYSELRIELPILQKALADNNLFE